MQKNCTGSFTMLDGEQFYKIENFDAMEDFFMTITSSSDIWNFCWSWGGVTAGRIDCNHAVFPYYTADKVSDAKTYTGPYTAIAVEKNGKNCLWEPFAFTTPAQRVATNDSFVRNIYKNMAGTKVWFEEINKDLEIAFRYAWTSSAKFGVVRQIRVENLSKNPQKIAILDGCRNILPACVTSSFQNDNSVLLDAYKKTEVDSNANLALFSVSSIVTDKAEPSEGLYANTGWISTDDPLILAFESPDAFADATISCKIEEIASKIPAPNVVKGKRPACFVCRTLSLNAGAFENWYQVFDTKLDAARIVELENTIKNRAGAVKLLEADINAGAEAMFKLLAEADGIQHTADTMACTHHCANVMFNIMRGGIFADEGKINVSDFLDFINVRNKSKNDVAKSVIQKAASIEGVTADSKLLNRESLLDAVEAANDVQMERLVLEYMPITFSRRHGDPSRPWNRFAIKLNNADGTPILNYEGNWRDIFQNWESLAYSYPAYIANMCAKFLNAMTADGFNPYRITRQGIDWEEPEPNNPWAQIGYWGDHQVIYLEKLLELYNKTQRAQLLADLNKELYTTANVPYRIKSYADILKNPRVTIDFDAELSKKLNEESATKGSDAKLIAGKDGQPALISLTAKLLQIVIAKAANFIPGGGIWLNTQRPEWNDANNALAGYGLSIVTLCYLRRFAGFLLDLYRNTPINSFNIPGEIAECFVKLGEVYSEFDPAKTATDDKLRKSFADKAGKLFETERNAFYKAGFSAPVQQLSKEQIISVLEAVNAHAEETIRLNKREDGLYHAYNTMSIAEDSMTISYLQEMLEGQVADLSSGMLKPEEALDVFKALRNSKLFEARQYSYMLYPDKELAHFCVKNCMSEADVKPVKDIIAKTGSRLITKDNNGVYHFCADFRNASVMEDYINTMSADVKPNDAEVKALVDLYEKTFNHQSFTGRSGTFYAYEGLGSIYWHMVSKLLLAAQENTFAATGETAKKLAEAYYDIRKGIGFNKEPTVYGAFPADPYSHTPSGQGAKQPGMTGQVKEEVLTRWGELGVSINAGIGSFNPTILRADEFGADGKLDFTWCGVPVTYTLVKAKSDTAICVKFADGKTAERDGTQLTEEESATLFNRNGGIKSIDVKVCLADTLL